MGNISESPKLLNQQQDVFCLGLVAQNMRVNFSLVMSGCRCLGQTWGFVSPLYDLMAKWSSNQYKLSLVLFSRSVAFAAC